MNRETVEIKSPFLKLSEAAELIQLSEGTIYRLMKQKALPGVKLGGTWRFHRESLEAWMREKCTV